MKSVNALLGFPSFLQYKIFITIVVAILCQCPSGLSFISTGEKKGMYANCILCQCPSGLSFISTCVPDTYFCICRDVSMPFWAFLHFYLKRLLKPKKPHQVCQCPSGLSFISTAPFWSPQK